MLVPPVDCPLCPELVRHRHYCQKHFPKGINQPVLGFGDRAASLFVIGLAPGTHGANRTGRPFTGDKAGDFLYQALLEKGFAKGNYGANRNDGLELINCFISNAVKCAPPQHRDVKPLELKNCQKFLLAELQELKNLKIILTLGHTAHKAILATWNFILANYLPINKLNHLLKLKDYQFEHGKSHALPPIALLPNQKIKLLNSYHSSIRNMNSGILTPKKFFAIFDKICAIANDNDKNDKAKT